MNTDENITKGLLNTLVVDLDLAQPISTLMEVCFAQAKARRLPPEIVVASAMSICVSGLRESVDTDMLLETTAMLCALRKHLAERGLLTQVKLSGARNPATED